MSAYIIEFQVRRVLRCERHGLGGVVDADFIRHGGALTAVSAALSPLYVNADVSTRAKIDELVYECQNIDGMDEEECRDEIEGIGQHLKELLDSLDVPDDV